MVSAQSLCNITNWLFYFLIILAVIFIIVAAFKYLTAAGEPEKVKSASHMLLYAAIAIVVGILAKAVPSLIGSVLGGVNTTSVARSLVSLSFQKAPRCAELFGIREVVKQDILALV